MISISPASKTMYQLNESVPFELGGRKYLIPVGFRTDGASIPRLTWSIIGSPFQPRFIEAAIIHDYCCVHKLNGALRDKLFHKNLRKAGVGSIRAKTMYYAVVSWRKVVHPDE